MANKVCKVIVEGLAPPDHPIYKEGWSITVGNGLVTAAPKPKPAKKKKKPQGKK
jgi:hypothetical protein